LWQRQPIDPQEQTGDYKAKARELERAGKLHQIRNVAVSMLVIALCLRGYLSSRFVLEQGCYAVAGVWSVVAIVIAFRKRNPEPAHFDSGLAYYRALLQVNRAAMLFTWTWLHLPIIIVAVAFILPITIRSPQLVKNTVPFLSLLAVWLGVLGWQNVKRVRWMTREIRRLCDS
jgi:hypothetical protein